MSVAPAEERLAPIHHLIGKASLRRPVVRWARHFAFRTTYQLPQLDLQVAECDAAIALATHVLP
jgi:hypothetical protein